MRTKAAVLWGLGQKWEVKELGTPKESEIMVKLTASGLCHSDEHLITGDIPIPFPVVGARGRRRGCRDWPWRHRPRDRRPRGVEFPAGLRPVFVLCARADRSV